MQKLIVACMVALFCAGTTWAVEAPPSAVADTATVNKNSQAVPINVLANDVGTGLRIVAVTQGAHGTVAIITATGANPGTTGLTYTPAANYVGPDQFTYTIIAGTNTVAGATATGLVAVNVVDINVPPPVPIKANPDALSVPKNSQAVPVNVLANDQGAAIRVTAVTQGAHGTVTLSTPTGANTAVVTYKPAADYVGPDNFSYTITDGNGATATGQVTVAVFEPTAPPPAPKANPDTAHTVKNSQGVAIFVLANDTGAGLTIVSNTAPLHGTTTILAATATAQAAIVYVPARDYFGPDGFAYTIKDSTGATATGQVAVTIDDIAPPPAPVANPDSIKVVKNSAILVVNVLANDTGSGIHVTAVTQPAHGTVTLSSPTVGGPNSASYVTYVPAKDYVGPDSFTYTITDSNGATATATVSVTVEDNTPPPPPLAANPDSLKVLKNSQAVPVNVLANDTGAGIRVTAVTQAAHGTVTLVTSTVAGANVYLTYAPAKDYVGPDSFTYTITDSSGATATATVTVTVEAPLPPPPPVAKDDTLKVPKNSPAIVVNVLANDSGTSIRVTAVTQAAHGAVTLATTAAGAANVAAYVTYAPATDYVGDDSFTYTITDSASATATATVTVSVVDSTPPPPPLKANPDSIKVAKNSPATPVNVLANDTGAGLRITAVTQPAHGTVVLNNVVIAIVPPPPATVTYASAKDYVGPDSFTYTITDSTGATSTATVTVSVEDTTVPPPLKANPDSIKVAKNSQAVPVNVLGNDTGSGLRVTAVTQPTHGTVTLTAAAVGGPNSASYVAYAPAKDYVGPDSFTYTITDSNSATATATVSVEVLDSTVPPPPPTLKANPDIARLAKNSPALPINVIVNDTGSSIKVTAVTQGAHGKVDILNSTAAANAGANPAPGPGVVTYTVEANFVGSDRFTYTITDSTGATATANVDVEVVDIAPAPPPPQQIVAVPDYAKVAKNSQNNPINVLGNDIGKGLVIVSVTQGDHGTVQLGNAGLVYTPAKDYVGPDKFTYTITATGTTAPASTGIVTVFVEDAPSGPRLAPDFATTQKNSLGIDINVLANDVGDTLSVKSFTQPAHGTVTAAVAGFALTYVPAKDFVGMDHFKYTAVDAKGLSGDADVTVNVLAAKPSPVVAHASPPIVPPGGTVAFFCDVAPDPAAGANAVVLTFAWDFGDGSTSDQRNPTHTYAAAGNYIATVIVSSGKTVLGSASLTILVKGPNDGPRANFTTSFPVAFEGVEIVFDATSSYDPANAIASYEWDFGDGTTGDMSIEPHTYAAAGEYKVSLKVTNEKGLSDSLTRPVQVLPKDSTFKSRVKYTAKLNFTAAATDGLVLDALIGLGTATVAAGTEVGVEIAGVAFTGKLDGKFSDNSSPTERWSVRPGPTGSGVASLHFQVKNAALAKAFSDAGVVPSTNAGGVVVAAIPVTITVDTSSVALTINSVATFARNSGKATVAGDTNATKAAKKAKR